MICFYSIKQSNLFMKLNLKTFGECNQILDNTSAAVILT